VSSASSKEEDGAAAVSENGGAVEGGAAPVNASSICANNARATRVRCRKAVPEETASMLVPRAVLQEVRSAGASGEVPDHVREGMRMARSMFMRAARERASRH